MNFSVVLCLYEHGKVNYYWTYFEFENHPLRIAFLCLYMYLYLYSYWIRNSPFEDRLPVLQPEECVKSVASRVQVKITSNESTIQFCSLIIFMLINSGWSLWKQQTVHMSTILFVCQSWLWATSSCSLEESHRLSRFWWMAQPRRVDRWSG